MNNIMAGAFLLGMIIVGILSMKRIKNASSYFVADRKRKTHTPTVTGPLLATITGGSSTIGIAGLGYAKVLVGAWWMLVGAMGLLVRSLWFDGKRKSYEICAPHKSYGPASPIGRPGDIRIFGHLKRSQTDYNRIR